MSFRFRLRTLIIIVAGISLGLMYFGSYYRLSRRGMQEAQANGIPGFLYVPYEEAVRTEDLTKHHRLTTFYFPANWLDQKLFGAGGPTICILWRLS